MGSQLLEKKIQNTSSLQIETLKIKNYEKVLHITDKNAGLSAIVALHNLTLGPALGGIRIQPYPTFDEALEDVLRLSQGMTYKSAVAQVGYGGGKSVIIADPKKDKTPALLMAFGQAVEALQGSYICAEDVGCTTEDVKIVRKSTKYVVGLPHDKSSGDPGPFTAWGTFRGIQATCKHLFGSDSLEGKTVAVQGLGNVGMNLVQFLFWAGAKLIVSDIDQEKVKHVAAKFGANFLSSTEILRVECDIFSPCALGGVINNQTLRTFRCKGIAGSANNQLLQDEHADQLKKRGILYAPDFVINAGGLLNVAAELEKNGYHPSSPRAQVDKIYDTLKAVYEIAQKGVGSTHAAAIALAEYRLKYGIGKRVTPPKFHHTAD